MFDKYLVKPNDSLQKIASKFDTSVEVIKDINNIEYDSMLRAGSQIIVPKAGQTYFNYYIIEKGDRVFMGNNE